MFCSCMEYIISFQKGAGSTVLQKFVRLFRGHVFPRPCLLIQLMLSDLVCGLVFVVLSIHHRGANRRNGSCCRGTPGGETHLGAARANSTGDQDHVDR